MARGVAEISGDVIGDDSYFPPERYPDGWEIDDMVWEYGAAISAIVVDDNTVALTLTPGEKPADPVVAARVVPSYVALQGNLDPLALATGGPAMAGEVQSILDAMRGRPFVFNLGHGISQHTPVESVAVLVDEVRTYSRKLRAKRS